MRLIQVKGGRGRQVVAEDDGEAWIVKGYRTVYDLALAAIRKKTTLAAAGRPRRPGRQGGPGGAACGGPRASADRPSRSRPSLVTGTGLTHLGSAATRDAMHNKVTSAAEEDADRFDEDVPDGARGRQAEAGQDRRPAGMVLQGRRLASWPRPARRSSRRLSPRTAARSPRSPASTSSANDGVALARRLRAPQRILRPRHRAAELPLARPFEAPPVLVRAGPCSSATCRTT